MKSKPVMPDENIGSMPANPETQVFRLMFEGEEGSFIYVCNRAPSLIRLGDGSLWSFRR